MMVAVILLVSMTAFGQRTDVKWARTTPLPITLDGQLNEAAWAVAESVKIVYGIDTHRLPNEHNDLGNLLKIPFQKKRSPKN